MFKIPFIATICCLTLTACATDPIEMSGDPAALPAFATFEIRDEQYVFAKPLTDAQQSRISSELRGAAVAALKERGYRESSPADVLVVLGAVSRAVAPEQDDSAKRTLKVVDTRALEPGQPDLPTAEPQDRIPVVGREGDLILYLLDAKTQRTLWRANSSGSASSPSEALSKARATYREMARKLPPAIDSKAAS